MNLNICWWLWLFACVMDLHAVDLAQFLDSSRPPQISKSSTSSSANLALTTLLNSGQAAPVSNSAPQRSALQHHQVSLESLFSSVQTNSNYQQAMQILQDPALTIAYQESMFSIQKFFIDYTTQALANSPETSAHAPISLTSLLSAQAKIPTTSPKTTSVHLTTFLSDASKASSIPGSISNAGLPGVTVQSKVNLASLLSQGKEAGQPTKKSLKKPNIVAPHENLASFLSSTHAGN